MILYLDTETLPLGTLAHVAAGLGRHDAPAGWEVPPYPDPPTLEYSPPANYRDPAKIAEHRIRAFLAHGERLMEYEQGRKAWPATALAAEWERRAPDSLDPLTAEIACLGYAIDDGPVEVADDAIGALDRLFRVQVPDIIVAHNAGFDAEMLWVSAVRRGLFDLAGLLARHVYAVTAEHKLYRGPRWVDTADLVPIRRQGGYRFGVSQERLAGLLGVAQPHPLRGAEVYDAVLDGRIAEVREHCRSDVGELREIYKALWGMTKGRRG